MTWWKMFLRIKMNYLSKTFSITHRCGFQERCTVWKNERRSEHKKQCRNNAETKVGLFEKWYRLPPFARAQIQCEPTCIVNASKYSNIEKEFSGRTEQFWYLCQNETNQLGDLKQVSQNNVKSCSKNRPFKFNTIEMTFRVVDALKNSRKL